MKRTFRNLSSLLLALVMLLSLSVTAFAADSSITFKGAQEGFDFQPGSEYTVTDLFDNFKGVLPGDVLEQKITVKNNTDGKVRIYMRAETEGMEDRDFLSQLSMTVDCRDKEIFDATPDKTAQLTNNTLLGTFKKKGSTELTVTLTVPNTMGNAYMSRTGVVPWTFVVEEIPESDTPHTGDWFQTGLWIGIAAVLAAAIVILLVVQRKRRAQNN